MRSKYLWHWPAAVAACIVIALSLGPSTRWVLVEHLRLQTGTSGYMQSLLAHLGVSQLPDGSTPRSGRSYSDALRRAAMRHPADPGSRIVLATLNAGSEGAGLGSRTSRGLREAARAMPDSPEIWAAILRYDAMGSVWLGRDKEVSTLSPPSARYWNAGDRSSPEQLAAFVVAAEAGCRADPGNGYLHAMRAVGLFAQRKDADALAAMNASARSRAWADFTWVETDARLRLDREAFGRHGAFSEMTLSAATLYPHLALLRGMARIAIAKAVQAEEGGRRSEGLAIRHDLMSLAALLRAEARTGLDAMVSAAMARMAVVRPGGAAAPDAGANGARPNARQLEAEYLRYLGSIGRSDEAEWARRQFSAARDAVSIFSEGLPRSPLLSPPSRLLLARWQLGLALMAIGLWCIAIAAASSLLARTRGRVWPVAVVVSLGLLLGAWMTLTQAANARLFPVYALVLSDLSGSGSATGPETAAIVLMQAVVPGAIAATVVIIGLAALTVGLVARKPFVQALSGITRWAAVVCVVAMAPLVVDTARREAALSATLADCRPNECAFFARAVGRAWPVREP
jgi:hypothetical protein